jgi:hypothetical protein
MIHVATLDPKPGAWAQVVGAVTLNQQHILIEYELDGDAKRPRAKWWKYVMI